MRVKDLILHYTHQEGHRWECLKVGLEIHILKGPLVEVRQRPSDPQ